MASEPTKQGRKLPRQKAGGNPVLLNSKVANTVLGCCEALMNLKIFVRQSDASGVKPTLEADIKFSGDTLVAIIPTSASPSDATGGSSITRYRLKVDSGAFLICRTWDGTTEGSTDVYIAKPIKLRTTLSSETKSGVTYSYSYAAVPDGSTYYYVRTVTGSDGSSEVDDIVPPYLYNDEIYAASITAQVVGGATCAALDMNDDARAWASR